MSLKNASPYSHLHEGFLDRWKKESKKKGSGGGDILR